MFKRFSAVLLSLLMVFALTSCTISESDISTIANLADSYLATESESVEATDTAENTATASTITDNDETTIYSDSDYEDIDEANEYTYYESAGEETQDEEIEDNQELLDESGTYDSKEDVALYIYQYGHLPDNYITKKEAQNLGWSGGSLEPYAPGKCIGGSYFGNYEGILPTADGREYHECDIDTLGASSRGAKRIVFSNDGLIYYTEDHYETFELLYGDDGQ